MIATRMSAPKDLWPESWAGDDNDEWDPDFDAEMEKMMGFSSFNDPPAKNKSEYTKVKQSLQCLPQMSNILTRKG